MIKIPILSKYKNQKKTFFLFALSCIVGVAIVGVSLWTLIPQNVTSKYKTSVCVKNQVILHSQRNVKKDLLIEIADVILRTEYFNGCNSANLYLSENRNDYQLILIINNINALSDSAFISSSNLFERKINYNLKLKKPLEFSFATLGFDRYYPLEEFIFDDLKKQESYSYLLFYRIGDYHTMLYNYDMPMKDIENAASAIRRLKVYFPHNVFVSFVFANSELTNEEYDLKIIIPEAFWGKTEFIKRMKNSVDYIQQHDIEKRINAYLLDGKTLNEMPL